MRSFFWIADIAEGLKQYMYNSTIIWFKWTYWEMLSFLLFSTEKIFSSLSYNSGLWKPVFMFQLSM